MAKRPSYYRSAFDILAPLYDLGIWFIGLLFGGENNLRRQVVEALPGIDLKPTPNIKVLEICCGTATISLMAAEKGAWVYGLDISRGMLTVAAEKAQEKQSKLRLVQADAAYIPFQAGFFDSAAVSMGLHEMPFDVTRTILKEIKRILKDNARLVIFDYHKAEGFTGFLQKIFFVFAEHETAREFINADLQKELREAGFKKFERKLLAKGALQRVTVNA
ncbi:MAG: methyltransferase domain-containing protein [Deltaproteobacteria bacterium]|nr:methyltransferase domain-containing protein [Deltaproteobacteria bacterium]